MRPLIPAVSAIQLVETAPEIEKTGVNIKVPFPACTHNISRAIYRCAFWWITQHAAEFSALKNQSRAMFLLVMTQLVGQHQQSGSLCHL